MNPYLERLRNLRAAAQPTQTANFPKRGRVAMAPLIDRLKGLISSLSRPEQEQPQSIEFFAERLRGRTRATPNRGELGRCLSALGYRRQRCWCRSADGFRALWHPPK